SVLVDGACDDSGPSTMQIEVYSSFSYSITTDDVSCAGESDGLISVTVSGNTNPVSYIWSNQIMSSVNSNVPSGTYTVTMTEGTCVLTASGTVNQPFFLGIYETHENICESATFGSINTTISGGTSPYTFLWNDAVTTE